MYRVKKGPDHFGSRTIGSGTRSHLGPGPLGPGPNHIWVVYKFKSVLTDVSTENVHESIYIYIVLATLEAEFWV